MIALGAQVAVELMTASVKVCVSPTKETTWVSHLQTIVDTMLCDSETVSKHAGRFGSAVTVAADMVERAVIKPFHAQFNSPMAGGKSPHGVCQHRSGSLLTLVTSNPDGYM